MADKTDVIGIKHTEEETISLEEMNSIDQCVKQLTQMIDIQNRVLADMIITHHPIMIRWLRIFMVLNQKQITTIMDLQTFMDKLWTKVMEDKSDK